jgi:hypothetical protein
VTLLGVLPNTGEYLTTVPRDVLGAVFDVVRASVTGLLMGDGPLSLLSRRQQQFAGVRGVVRALVQLGTHAVASEWLTNVSILAQAGDADLAQYAAWTLGEWAARRNLGAPDDTVTLLVGPALRAVTADSRIRVRANGLRGLVLLERTAPSPAVRAVIEAQRNDPRIAIERALAGQGVT